MNGLIEYSITEQIFNAPLNNWKPDGRYSAVRFEPLSPAPFSITVNGVRTIAAGNAFEYAVPAGGEFDKETLWSIALSAAGSYLISIQYITGGLQ